MRKRGRDKRDISNHNLLLLFSSIREFLAGKIFKMGISLSFSTESEQKGEGERSIVRV